MSIIAYTSVITKDLAQEVIYPGFRKIELSRIEENDFACFIVLGHALYKLGFS
jgi:hypothetical protein